MLLEKLRKLKVWSCSKLCDSFRWLNPSESRDVFVRAVNPEPFRDNGLNFPDSSYFSTKGVDLKHANLLYAFAPFLMMICETASIRNILSSQWSKSITPKQQKKRKTHFHHQLSQNLFDDWCFASISFVNEIMGLVLGPTLSRITKGKCGWRAVYW